MRTVLAEKCPVRAIFFPTQSIRYSGDLVSIDFYDSLEIIMKVIPNCSIFGNYGCYSSSRPGKADKTEASRIRRCFYKL
ncbi:hypothetical protein [Cyanobacterium sp. uoEpiScrs1]|uniref:hypothetical protein n=1 Tax=Cyanobacterium sp. uoEpiScrs1 TaxID=2976343 RepID=UPI002269EE29|nr:hypothetical protein [Cyanobacterium sp. uoEpiScrs1]